MERWSHWFIGRDRELESLRQSYEEASRGEARLVAIVAESGFGKTRLVQEFYHWLSTRHDGVEGSGYWPDRLLRQQHNLIVNPDCAACGVGGAPMPFLWWALRLPDPGARNEILVGAMWHSVEQLKPHLDARVRMAEKARLERAALVEIGKGAGSVAIDVVGNLLSFGLLGIGKTVVETSVALHALKERSDSLAALGSGPAAARAHADDSLTEIILADLHKLAKASPGSLPATPLVIVIDDAQWLGGDTGARAFAATLVERARRENWPLLLILTVWEREWRQSRADGLTPGCLLDLGGGDRIIELAPMPGLDAIVSDTFPGLTAEHRTAIVDIVDGNPRFLDEMLLYLDRNPRLFSSRDTGAAFTEAGFAEARRQNFASLVIDRFVAAPEPVRLALGLSSLQGVAFSPRVARATAARLAMTGIDEAIDRADDPYAFIAIGENGRDAEFRQRVYQELAFAALGNIVDEDAAQAAFSQALGDVVKEPATASERELSLAIDNAGGSTAVASAVELIRRAKANHDPRLAGEVADRALRLLRDSGLACGNGLLCDIVDAHWAWFGPNETVAAVLTEAVALNGSAADEGAVERCHRIQVLKRLGIAVEELEGPAAALPLHFEAEAQARRLAVEWDDARAREVLADAVTWVGDSILALQGAVSARPWRTEAEHLYRLLVEELDTAAARHDLALAKLRLGHVTNELEGPKIAYPIIENAVGLLRACAEETQAPEDRRFLAVGLAELAGSASQVNGRAAARPLLAEAEALLRTAVADLGTPAIRSNLVEILTRLAASVAELDGQAAAKPMLLETVALSRSLAAELGTHVARKDFAAVLCALASSERELNGPHAALPSQREAEAILRVLAAELNTIEARRSLAIAVAGLGDLLRQTEGAPAARPLHTESVELTLSIAVDANSALDWALYSTTLMILAGTVQALDGPAAAKSVWAEAEGRLGVLAAERPEAVMRFTHSLALLNLGVVIDDLEGAAAARPWLEKAEALSRSVLAEEPTPPMRRNLARALARLGSVVELLEGPLQARPYYAQSETLSRILTNEEDSPGNRSELVVAMARLGDVEEALHGHTAAEPIYAEAEALSRTLMDELETTEARRSFAHILNRSAKAVSDVRGAAAARPRFEEVVALHRALSVEDPSPGPKRDLGMALLALGESREAIEGPACVRSLRLEAQELFAELHTATPGVMAELGLLCARRDLLRGDLVGETPWSRPFAFETYPARAAVAHRPKLKILLADFRNWASEAGPETALAWVESIGILSATVKRSLGEFKAATAEAEESLPALRELAGLRPGTATDLLISALLCAGLAHAESGPSDRALTYFDEALGICRQSSAPGRPACLRRHAVAAWFSSQTLRAQGKGAEACSRLAEGEEAAAAFAQFGIYDGRAILEAYRATMARNAAGIGPV